MKKVLTKNEMIFKSGLRILYFKQGRIKFLNKISWSQKEIWLAFYLLETTYKYL